MERDRSASCLSFFPLFYELKESPRREVFPCVLEAVNLHTHGTRSPSSGITINLTRSVAHIPTLLSTSFLFTQKVFGFFFRVAVKFQWIRVPLQTKRSDLNGVRSCSKTCFSFFLNFFIMQKELRFTAGVRWKLWQSRV